MKNLYVCNTAGVGSVIAKYMDRLFGTKSLVVLRQVFDLYGFTTYGELWNCGATVFTLKCLLKARDFDIVHVNDFDKLINWLRKLYWRKPIVIHYHGDSIRGVWKEKQKYWKNADFVLYSVKDVENSNTPVNAVWLPNPVDTELFKPLGNKRKPKSALSMDNLLDKEKASKFAKEYGLELTIQRMGVPYMEMPSLLNKFEFYIDAKTRGFSMSKTALEALACGTRVINCHGKVVDKLPEEHKPENVCKKLMEIYRSLM
jgi:glycosyltransferase involved in cell wall biosynthesis